MTTPDTTPDSHFYMPTWLTDTPLGELYRQVWEETGDPQQAIEAVRASDLYEQYFAGNRRDDGSVRLTEDDYVARIEDYEDSLFAVGIDREFVRTWMRDDMANLIRDNVTGQEFWRMRVQPLYNRVVAASDQIQAEYAQQYGILPTVEAIMASAFSDGVHQAMLDRSIGMAEIRGAYRESYDDIVGVEAEFFDQLYARGDVDLASARRLFTASESMVPALSVLAARHANPDDEFDLNEFTAATVYNDPLQADRMRRLIAQERASFQMAGSQLDVVRDRITGASGLIQR